MLTAPVWVVTPSPLGERVGVMVFELAQQFELHHALLFKLPYIRTFFTLNF